jgi:hypothetical protein
MGTGLYICFSMLTTKQRLEFEWYKYFPNIQVTQTVYFKERCWYCVLLHITSKITIKTVLPLL